MNSKKFCHLHLHSEYSLLDSSAKIKKIISKAKELKMDSIAITDHGVMYGCVSFYKEAKKAGIKPILGCEVYVAEKSKDIKTVDKENATYHLVLLVKNEKGYENLMKIVSSASTEGFYYRPRTDHEFLRNHSEGLIALSACLGGEVQKSILKGNYEKAKISALRYKEIFNGDFYLEIQNHKMQEQLKVNEVNIKLSKETGIPLVATNDVHYIEKEDSKSHDVLMCIQTAKTIEDTNRKRYPSNEFYLKSQEEMWNIFGYVPEAIENTIKIANECNFDYEFHKLKLPKYPVPDNKEPYDYLREVCYYGLIENYEEFKSFKDKDLNVDFLIKECEKNEKCNQYIKRLEYELAIIKQMGYIDYFLITWDFIKYANDNGIPTGPGRGSAAGSIIAYTLGITKIDPIKYNLIFERFLNPERVSMPDIDSDFCYERRQEVIDYVVKKYGEENVSQIITFGTMAARACIRDVGRAMDYSYVEVDRVAKMVPTMLGITIEKAIDLNPEFKKAYENEDRVKTLIDVSKALEGLPRHSSTHAAGVVIASDPLVEFVPLQKNEDMIVTQFDMTTLEELGLLKMDFLGLRTLTVMSYAVKLIKENKGIDIDLNNINFDDKKVYEMIGEGKTAGVFQLESSGMTSFMKDLKPDCLEDIIAGISLYRPGPMAEIPRYVEGKRNKDSVHYESKELENILDVTYGVMVYQEQVMEIVRKLAGYSLGRSDMVRRAMSKKKHDVMEEERKNFIYGIIDKDGEIEVPGCLRNGVSESAANKIFDSMMDFASYAFNKSHAAAYAVIGYQTGYLMCYYPVETIAAMLNSFMGNVEKVTNYIKVAESQGIKVLPPNINQSFAKFTVKDDVIIFGLAAIRNVGMNVIESVIKTRKEKGNFESLVDFIKKVDLGAINKRAVESLIKSGAFDDFKVYRSKMLYVYEKLISSIVNDKKRNIDGQLSLFELDSDLDKDFQDIYPDINEYPKNSILAMEKEMTGLYLSGHPLDEYVQSLKIYTSCNIESVRSSKQALIDGFENDMIIKNDQRVIIGGIISTVNQKITKTNSLMAFLTLEDLTSNIEVVVFPKMFDKNKGFITEDNIITVKGRVSIKEDEDIKIICEEVNPLIKSTLQKVYIKAENKKKLKDIKLKLMMFPSEFNGETPLYLFDASESKSYLLNNDMWINLESDVMINIRELFGEENVKLID